MVQPNRRKSRQPVLETRERPEFRFAGSPIEIKGGVSDAGDFEGYGSVFGVEDSYGDVVAPGAFTATLAEHRAAGTMPAMLWNHQADEPIGVWTDMSEDAKGLLVKGRLLLDTPEGRTAHARIKSRAIRGLSIGFVARAYVDGDVRTVTNIDLWEVSPVTFPANRQATVTNVKTIDPASVRDIATERDLEEFLEQLQRDAGASGTKAKADAKGVISRVRSSMLAGRDVPEGVGKAMASAERLLRTLSGV